MCSVLVLFKIDLIVWKSETDTYKSSTTSKFKIDLIVWKYQNGQDIVSSQASLK